MMMTNSMNSLEDWIKEARHISILYDCLEHPLRPGLDEIVRTNETGRKVRDKVIAKLKGMLSEEDFSLDVWSDTVSKSFRLLTQWIQNYTLELGITKDWDLDKAINEIRERIINERVNKIFSDYVLNPSSLFWREKKEYFQKKCESTEAKAEKIESAKNLLKAGISFEIVANSLDLFLKEVRKL